jgi:anti-sigma regulatory factor (Ser/Thr protein kinase)
MDAIATTLELALAPTQLAPSRARAAISQWLGEQHDDDLLAEIALLLVSELVTNCVRHARISGEEPLRLRGSLAGATLRIELWDNGTEGTVAPRPRHRPGSAGGYGLDLVARLSSAWGVERDADGTVVWLELPATARATT